MSSIEDENSNSSSDDEGIEKELLARASELEAQLLTNKYLYDAHVEVINIYKKLTDLNSLREAYQRFQENFPLTPTLWLEWIRDEIKIASSKEEQQQILKLFEKAVDDYLSVELWIEYAQYSIGLSDLETTRGILEKGLTSAGLHASEGSLLWDTLRELENAHISFYQKDSEEWVDQVKLVAQVFKRQLSVPLLNMENTYLEWLEWFKTLPEGLIDPKTIEWGYNKALQNLKIYIPFEDKLSSAGETELYGIYKEYINIVKDPLTATCLYERALVTLCLIPSIWEDYINFSFKMKEVALKITHRSIRNCPWSEELWVARLRVLESCKVEENQFVDCFEKALHNISMTFPLDVWFVFLEYYHRNCKDNSKIDKLFSKALEQVTPAHDPTCKLSRWYARLVAKRGDIVEARRIWRSIIAESDIKTSINAWLEFVNLERRYGEIKQVRNIFKWSLSSCKEWAHYLVEEWLLFEREEGSLEDVMKCSERRKEILKKVQQYSDNKSLTTNTPSDKPAKSQKRKHDNEENLDFKKLKLTQTDRGQKSKAPPPSASKVIEKDPKTTVFVSNLHPRVGEQQLTSLFPNALNISIVLDRNGRSRCFGYIHFSKEEEAMTALARDRVPLDGRPVFISELKPEKGEKKQDFKYPTTVEENKLFVKGIPLTKTKKDVEDIFKSYNPVDVRLVSKKNGQSKGIAYVEFKTKEEAQKALQLNSTKIDDSELFVAVSAPPQKKIGDKTEPDEPIRHSRSRLQMPMIPRILKVKSTREETKNNGNVEDDSNKKKKSNTDFRNMFLNK